MNANGKQGTTGVEQKILIVDDEPQILSSLQDLLEDDFSVLAVTDAKKALDLLQEQEVAVILSDQRMPGLSGDQFLREAQKRSRATRLLITGYADLKALVRAVNEGKIYGYVAKPWDPEALRSLIFKAADYFKLAQQLEVERNLLHLLMDNVPDNIYFKDTASRFTRINRAQARGLGISAPEEAVGKTDLDFLRKEFALECYADEQQIIASGQPLIDKVEKTVGTEGQIRWVSTTKVPVKDQEGRITGIIGISRDITQRQQTEEALSKSREELETRERHLRTIIEAEPECVKLIAADGRLLEMNPAGLAMIEADSLEQVKGQSIYPLIAPESREAFRALTAGAFAGKPGQLVFEAIGLKATRRWFDTHIVPLRNSQDQIIAALGITRDITERKLLEQQLLQAQKLEAIGRLAGGVAHDFNNLLTITSGYSEFLLRRLNADHPHYEGLREIQQAAGRGAGLIRQLLAFSRRQVLEPRVLDLNTVVRDLEKMLDRLIGENIRLVTEFSPSLGQVKADPGQLEQVLMNLIVNARDAMPEGGTLVIETRNAELDEGYASQHVVVKQGSYVLLAVSDTGVGMDAQTQTRIFEPFFTTKGPEKGTGLGLATVYGIVKQSEGYIWVYSELGKGTSFKIYLPRIDGAADPRVREEVPQVARGAETVLLVEDEAALRELVALILREAGYTVLEASRGEEALQLSARHQGPVQLVITDMVMPGMSGPALAEQLAALHPGLKVFYMSGYSEGIVGQQGVLKPGMLFLQKPFKSSALLLKVREALDRDR